MRRLTGAAIVCAGLIGAVVLAISCYTIPEPACGFVCGDGSACPSDYTCASDNFCHRNGSSPASCVAGGDAGVDAELVSPQVVSTMPADGATGVPLSTITATFDEPIDDSTVSLATFVVSSGGTQIVGTYAYDDTSMTATFTPTAVPQGAVMIDVSLTAGISSIQGAPLVPASWSFTTADDQPPTLSSSDPLAGATAVPDTTAITITFDEPVTGVDPTSFAVAAPGPVPIAGTITGSGATYVFTPSAALPVATLITVTLSSAITDLAGNPLALVSFSFTTQ